MNIYNTCGYPSTKVRISGENYLMILFYLEQIYWVSRKEKKKIVQRHLIKRTEKCPIHGYTGITSSLKYAKKNI